MIKMKASAAREEFAEALNRVAYGGERIVVERHGKEVAALISIEDLKALRALEDRIDLEDAIEALKEPGSVSLDELRKELKI